MKRGVADENHTPPGSTEVVHHRRAAAMSSSDDAAEKMLNTNELVSQTLREGKDKAIHGQRVLAFNAVVEPIALARISFVAVRRRSCSLS
jgi:hypothetical protein